MAAAGTGLPGGRGDVATTITDMRGYGAGEAAAAEGMARAADGLARLVDVIEPAVQQQAVKLAEHDAAAGQFSERMVITGADAAYNQALTQGTMARLGNQRDADLDALKVQHAYDPDGFQRAAQEYRTNALGGAVPGGLAIPWAQEFDQRQNSILSTIRGARAESDLREAKSSTTARIDRLTAETIGLANGRPLAEALASDDIQGNILQIALMYDGLAGNPAFGVSAEEADASRGETIGRIKAGAVSAAVVNTLRTAGADAAYAELQTILTDPALPLTTEERQLAFNSGREAVNQEVGLANQRANQAQAVRSEAERELNRRIDEDVARVELTGQGAGLTEDEVRATGGNAAVSRWYKARAEASEFHQLVGDLSDKTPEEAAAIITERTAARGLSALPVVQDENDLNSLTAALIQVESRGQNGLTSADPDGAGPAGGGAMGVMQLLPATAQRMAQGLGLPFDQNRLRTDPAYNRQLGRAYLSELLNRYNGDAFLAVTAYHAGEGNVDGWLRSVGDPRSGRITREAFLEGVEARGNPRSAEYPRKVLAALGAGQASAAWDAYQGQRSARAADPAGSVTTDFAVRTARERWQANPSSVPAGESFVQANLDAQDRGRIAAGQRRTLPVPTLAIYAGDLERFARAGDTEAFQAYQQSLVRQFGRHGRAVLQDALEVRGDTRFAAQVSARVAQQAALGQRPTARDVEQAGTAARAETINRAGTGTTDRSVSAMSVEELNRLAYGQ